MMKGDDLQEGFRDAEVEAAQAMIADLRVRLQSSLGQERAARVAARGLAREAALLRRLLAFAYGAEAPVRPHAQQVSASGTSPVQAVPLATGAIFSLDDCQLEGTSVRVSGWAFHPARAWNALVAKATVLFRHGHQTYAALARRKFRTDVAAHFALQPEEVSGGARGLANVGFVCEIAADSLPREVELEVVLRLECDGIVCEQPTGRYLLL